MGTETQRCGAWWAVGVLLAVGLYGCPGDTELAKGDANEGDGNAGGGGSGASGSHGGGSSGSGASGSGTGGAAGTGSSGSSGGGRAGSASMAGSGGGAAGSGDDGVCAPGVAIPAICKLCADGSCGQPVCKGGDFTGDFACAGDGGGSGGNGGGAGGGADGCVHAGCSSQLCLEASVAKEIATTCEFREEYACYQAAECARKSDGTCGFTESQELTDCLATAASGGALRWHAGCGDPVCSSQPDPDDPSVPNCTDTDLEGSACDTEGQTCETLSCGGHLVCAPGDPAHLVPVQCPSG